MPIINANIVFGFHIHHIFPRELYDRFGNALNALFANQTNGLSLNMQGNHIALYSDPATAAAVQAAIVAGDDSFIQNGFGGSVHGSHYGYNRLMGHD